MATSKRKRRYKEDYINFGFSYTVSAGIEKPLCVFCSAVLTNESMKPNKLKRHLESKHPEFMSEGPDYFKKQAKILENSETVKSEPIERKGNPALMASYTVSLQIARAMKPHAIGEDLILSCAKDIVNSIVGEETVESLKPISLSNSSVQRRIMDMADDILSQVITEIHTAPLGLFTLQIDESTDVDNFAHLTVCVRYISDGNFKDEFLCCKPIEMTTGACDVFEMVGSFFEQHELRWGDVGGICTDGASVMLGCRSGFQQIIKNVSPQAIGVHCTTNCQMLAKKTLPGNLRLLLQSVIAAVNFIKANGANSYLFNQLCHEMDAKSKVFLLNTDDRWLSKGNILQRIFHLKDEVIRFFIQQKNADFAKLFTDQLQLSRIAYLVDFFFIMNKLILSLQGEHIIIFDLLDKLNAFQLKLDVWLEKINMMNLYMFPTLNAFLEEDTSEVKFDKDFQHLLIQHLNVLKEELARYNPNTALTSCCAIAKNPFSESIENVPEQCRSDFLDLISNDCARSDFETLTLSQFWIKQLPRYPVLSEVVLRLLMPFSSTYTCETAFSSLLLIKSKKRNRLQAEDDLRCAVSKTSPRIEKLTMGKQYQPSH